MTDKITIERETLERAIEALETCTPGDYSTGHVIHPGFHELAIETALTDLQAALAAQPAKPVGPVAYTYASTQATKCACCGEHKHTPLRIDAMDGYVCLTCIDHKLGSLLGEFGYPEPPATATVPPGYALVPIEPTQTMLDAMQSGAWMPGNYRAMIAAAGEKL